MLLVACKIFRNLESLCYLFWNCLYVPSITGVSDQRRKRWLALGETVAESVSAIEVEFDDDIKGLYTIRGSSTIVPVSER